MSETKNFNVNVNVNTNIENGKGAQMSETIKRLVEEYRELKEQKRDGKKRILYNGSLLRSDDPALWDGEDKCIRITDDGLLYGYAEDDYEVRYYYFDVDDDWLGDDRPTEDEWAAMNEVGSFCGDADCTSISRNIHEVDEVYLHGDWDSIWDAVNAEKIDLWDVDWEALEIDGTNLSYGQDHAVRNVVNADKLDLDSERAEYAGKVVEDIGDNINSAKYLDEIGWDEKEDLQAIINAWDEDYYVPNWLVSLCKEKGVNIPATLIENKAEEEEEETAND